jgi:transcriptional regulator with XRE-family HTH domain
MPEAQLNRPSPAGAPEPEPRARLSAAGWILRQWRSTRGMSQLALASEASVSTRHLSFVETGRAEPSRELLLRLGAALDMPPRDRNALLSAAGYQPAHREASWDAPENRELRHAVRLILQRHEPYGAVAVNRDWDLVMCNAGFARFASMLISPAPSLTPFEVTPTPRLNLLSLTLDPDAGVRPHLRNWDTIARHLVWRARAETGATRDRARRALLERLLRFPGVAKLLENSPDEPGAGFVLPLELAFGEHVLRLFTTITTLGTPQDLSACELRIEAYHPADEATDALVRALALEPPRP